MTYEQIIQKAGKQIEPVVYYYNSSNNKIEINRDNFVSAKPTFYSPLIGTVMKGLSLELKVELPNKAIYLENKVKYGTYTDSKLYGPFYFKENPIYSADTKTYTHQLYDEFLKSMVEYKPITITYPCTVIDYFLRLISELGLTTTIKTLPNGLRKMAEDIYAGIKFTYRDVFDDIGKATATLFEIDGITVKKCGLGLEENQAVINDDILKNVNIDFGNHYGPINTVILSRSDDSDYIYLSNPDITEENRKAIRISDCQLMNDNNRSDYLQELLDALSGIEYDVFDTDLVGYGGFTPLQKIKFETGNKVYYSYAFNNEIEISKGYSESIHADMLEESETDYSVSDNTDKRLTQVYIITDKKNKEIKLAVEENSTKLEKLSTISNAEGETLNLINSSGNELVSFNINGKSIQEGIPTPDSPKEIKSIADEGELSIVNEFEDKVIDTIVKIGQPLASLSEIICDSLEMTNQKGTITQNIGKIVFDGSDDEKWTLSRATEFYSTGYSSLMKKSGLAICSHYKYSPIVWSKAGEFGISSGGNVWLITLKSFSTLQEFKNYLSLNPITVYYELDKPIISDIEAQKIKTLSGDSVLYCNTDLKSNMSCTYVNNSSLLDAFYLKEETNAQINITKNQIELSVSDQTSRLENNMNSQNQTINDNLELVKQQQADLDLKSTGLTLKVQSIINDGVSLVKNTMFTMDDTGLKIATSSDAFNSLMNNKGMYIYSYDNLIARYDKDGSWLNTLEVTKRANVVGLIYEKATDMNKNNGKEIVVVYKGW